MARASFLGALEEIARAPGSEVSFTRVHNPRDARVRFHVERVLLPIDYPDALAVTRGGVIVIFWRAATWHRGLPTWARTERGDPIEAAGESPARPVKRLNLDTVVLHELCNALGLPDSTDPDSPRYQGRPSTLTALDVAALNEAVSE